MQGTQFRRRSPACTALQASEGGTGSQAPPSLFNALYTVLGGWLIEPPAPQDAAADVPAAEPAHSISQVLEHMGSWALRAAMLNTQMCLPVNVWPSPSDSRSQSPQDTGDPAALTASAAGASSNAAVDPMQPPSCGSSSKLSAAVQERCGQDAVKGEDVGHAGKQQAGPTIKLPTSNSSNSLDQHYRATPAPQAPHAVASDSSAGAVVGSSAGSSSDPGVSEELECLRREVRCLRTSLGTMYLTCSSLKEENQRLRSADGGEELLSDALQQLLAEKNALQQEVSRLAMQNQALQELLDYTAAAAGAAPTASHVTWGCCIDSSSSSMAIAAAAAAAGQGDSEYAAGDVYDFQQLQQHSQQHQQQHDEEQEHCGYWLATPTGSLSIYSAAASGRNSPADSSSCCGSGAGDGVSAPVTAAAAAAAEPISMPTDWQSSLILAAEAAAAAVAAEAAAAAAVAVAAANAAALPAARTAETGAGEVSQADGIEVAAGMAAVEFSDSEVDVAWAEASCCLVEQPLGQPATAGEGAVVAFGM